MSLTKKTKDKKVNFEFNKEYIRVVTSKIANNDAQFITNSFNEMHPADAADIIDQSIKIVETNRGGKITCHGPGQLIFYFVLDLRNKKDIRKFINSIEKTIIETLKTFDIETFADKDNVGIWHNENGKINKVAAIGVRVKKWIAYHGFAINIDNNLNQYKKIIPCGIKDKGITNLVKIKKKDYSKLGDLLIKKFISNLKN